MNKGWTRWFRIGLVGAMLGIGYLAFTPLQHEVTSNTWDKGNHFIAFFVLALLVDGAWPAIGSRPIYKGGILFGYGVVIECVQSVIPHRQLSFHDVLANSLGILIYYMICYGIKTFRAMRRKALHDRLSNLRSN